MSRIFILRSPEVAAVCWRYIKEQADLAISNGRLVRVSVGWLQDKRNVEQNALLHAVLSEIAEQKEWAGQKWDIDDWKRLLTAAWMRARNESATLVPSLDGGGRFDVLYRRTSTLTVAECSELIEYIYSWAAMNGVAMDKGTA